LRSSERKSVSKDVHDRLLGLYHKGRHLCSTNHNVNFNRNNSEFGNLNRKGNELVKLELRPCSVKVSHRDV